MKEENFVERYYRTLPIIIEKIKGKYPVRVILPRGAAKPHKYSEINKKFAYIPELGGCTATWYFLTEEDATKFKIWYHKEAIEFHQKQLDKLL